MTVTREVIYDLLPAYFSGDVSADTRALVEEFLATDPEFRRMVDRFHALHADRRAEADVEAPAEAERDAFNGAKARFKLRHAAVVWAAAAVIAGAMATPAMVDAGFAYPGLLTGAVFAIMAVITWLWSRASLERMAAVSAGGHGFARWNRKRGRRARNQA